ncbi:MAG: MFS transporter, partial [Acidobacteriota bacterium]|nr:MFS transporter [Acidobacteriota bacterium]
MEKLKESLKLKKSLLYSYGVADMFFVLMVCMEVYYFSMFLTDYAEFSLKTFGIIMVITGILDIVCALLAGIILEKVTLRFGGKYRSWFLVGPLPIVLLFTFQFAKIGPEPVAVAVIIVAFVASHLLWNTVAACGGAMIGRMTKDAGELTILSTSRGQGMTASNLLIALSGPPLIALFCGVTSRHTGMALTVAVYGVLMILGYLYIYKMTAGMDPYDTDTAHPTQKGKGPSLGEIVRLVFRNTPLLMLMVAEIFRNAIILISAAMATYWTKYVVGDESVMTSFMLVTAIAGILGTVIATPIGLRFGKRHAYWTSLVVAGAAYASSWFFGADKWAYTLDMNLGFFGNLHIVVNAYMLMFGLGSLFAVIASCMNTALFNDTVVYGEWKFGKSIHGFTMALLNVPIKLGVLIRSAVIGLGLAAIGYVANADPTPGVVSGIVALMSFSVAAVCALAAVVFFFGYKIQDSTVAKMQEDLA